MDFIGLIEQRIMPRLRYAGEQIANEFPSVNVNVCSYGGGALTGHLVYGFAIDCCLEVRQSENDNVSLIILLQHLEGQPTISAEVTWGAPSGFTELELYEDEIFASEEVLIDIEDKLPLMINTLRSALARGKPSIE